MKTWVFMNNIKRTECAEWDGKGGDHWSKFGQEVNKQLQKIFGGGISTKPRSTLY